MEYSSEQVKSIFTLIQQASLYAFPLLLSLLFPLVWVAFKRLLGLYEKREETVVVPWTNWITKTLIRIKQWIKIQGMRADQRVFIFSICLFVAGGVLLKLGEYNEEHIRKRTLALKTLYKANNVISFPVSVVVANHFDEEEIETICDRYPNEFIVLPAITEKDRTLRCVDSAFYRDYKARAFPMLAAYFDESFKHTDGINLSSVWSQSNKVKSFFINDVIYDFLAAPENKGKFSINAYTNTYKTKCGKDSIDDEVYINKQPIVTPATVLLANTKH